MPGRSRRKPTLVEIVIVIAILMILFSIAGGRKSSQRQPTQAPSRPIPASQYERDRQGNPYFYRP